MFFLLILFRIFYVKQGFCVRSGNTAYTYEQSIMRTDKIIGADTVIEFFYT